MGPEPCSTEGVVTEWSARRLSTPGTGRTCRRLPSFQPVLYAISSESLSPQKFDNSAIAGSGDHSATLSLSAVKLICWQKNQLQPQSDLLHGTPCAATLPRLSHRTSFDGSRSTSSAEQLFCEAVTIISMWNPATVRSHQFCLRNRMFTKKRKLKGKGNVLPRSFHLLG